MAMASWRVSSKLANDSNAAAAKAMHGDMARVARSNNLHPVTYTLREEIALKNDAETAAAIGGVSGLEQRRKAMAKYRSVS